MNLQEEMSVSNEEATATSPGSPGSGDDKERKQFMAQLSQFFAELGKTMPQLPVMGYKELDLYTLFTEVLAFGGFMQVVKNVGTWSKIWKKLANYDPSITDSSFRLRKNYERYLLDFEFKHFPEHRFTWEKQIQAKKNASQSKNLKKHKKRYSPPNKDISRDGEGKAQFPLVLGEITILNLGQIVPRPPFLTEKHVWPVGFESTRYFSSMINPEKRVKYTSRILDGGDKPQFEVVADDDLENPIYSHSPSGAWRTVLKRVMGSSLYEDSRKNIAVSGRVRFGLAHPVCQKLLMELPHGDKISRPLSPTASKKRQSIDLEVSQLLQLRFDDIKEPPQKKKASIDKICPEYEDIAIQTLSSRFLTVY